MSRSAKATRVVPALSATLEIGYFYRFYQPARRIIIHSHYYVTGKPREGETMDTGGECSCVRQDLLGSTNETTGTEIEAPSERGGAVGTSFCLLSRVLEVECGAVEKLIMRRVLGLVVE